MCFTLIAHLNLEWSQFRYSVAALIGRTILDIALSLAFVFCLFVFKRLSFFTLPSHSPATVSSPSSLAALSLPSTFSLVNPVGLIHCLEFPASHLWLQWELSSAQLVNSEVDFPSQPSPSSVVPSPPTDGLLLRNLLGLCLLLHPRKPVSSRAQWSLLNRYFHLDLFFLLSHGSGQGVHHHPGISTEASWQSAQCYLVLS